MFLNRKPSKCRALYTAGNRKSDRGRAKMKRCCQPRLALDRMMSNSISSRNRTKVGNVVLHEPVTTTRSSCNGCCGLCNGRFKFRATIRWARCKEERTEKTLQESFDCSNNRTIDRTKICDKQNQIVRQLTVEDRSRHSDRSKKMNEPDANLFEMRCGSTHCDRLTRWNH